MTSQKVLPASRQEQILSMIRSRGSVRVSEVAQALDVAPITVRRDIALLAEQGLVEQIRGGAQRLSAGHRNTSLPENLTIGIITPSLDFYWPAIINGANETADLHGVHLLLQGSTFAARDNLAQVQEMISNSNIDGLFLVPNVEDENAEELSAYLQEIDLPVVLVERTLKPHGSHTRAFESVNTAHRRGADMAVRYLAELGHQRIGLLTDKFIPSRLEIEAGWQAAMQDLGLRKPAPRTDTTLLDDAARSQKIDDFIDECLDTHTTAMLVHSDEASLVVLERLHARKVEVPQEISVITYDDELATLSRPTLTAVAPPKHALGSYAIEVLVNRIARPDTPLAQVELEPTLIVRNSTAAPKN